MDSFEEMTEPSSLPHGGKSRLSSHSDDSGCDLMDDSLTDMQWLPGMDAGADFPALSRAAVKKRSISSRSEKENHKKKDGCRKKLDYSTKKLSNKPPLSYAALIALAICSTPQRMMTLSSIYRWIETTFPFYCTPEAKAWKNSIRHNLSIRKNMFMKVYQNPPRRGNGSYWTLLSDGEEELKRAIPLFTTLQPPIIDEKSIYNRIPSTHTVKSKGQFVPVLPSTCTSNLPYFATETSSLSPAVQSEDVEASTEHNVRGVKRTHAQVLTTPKHLVDHSYAKPMSPQPETQSVQCVSDGSDPESSFEAPPTPKRKKNSSISVHRPLHEWHSKRVMQQQLLTSTARQEKSSNSNGSTPNSKEQESSLGLLNSSFLTPVKNLLPDVEIDSLSLSPLFNFVTPRRGNTPPNMNLSSPFSPLKHSVAPPDVDSGVFSPLKFGTLKFSTPIGNMSPLTDLLPPNTFSTPHRDIFPSLKVLDTSGGFGYTPLRPGSLQALGLPGLTPPSASYCKR